ncbi:hypothetical protein [[Kitasatospora] papulosa]|uniref:hypothetical protein n=1 Tax=[Kitasatospora] papulosa TaxID=1464011 RepID=UPI0036A3281F
MSLPDYFKNQLPEGIRQMVDHPDFNPWGEMVDAYTHWAQYTYPMDTGDGDPSDTMLATVMGVEPMSVEVGQSVCLYGVWVQVASVKTETEKSVDDGRLITFHTVEVLLSDIPPLDAVAPPA